MEVFYFCWEHSGQEIVAHYRQAETFVLLGVVGVAGIVELVDHFFEGRAVAHDFLLGESAFDLDCFAQDEAIAWSDVELSFVDNYVLG